MSDPVLVALVDDDADLRAATAQLLTIHGHDVRAFDHAGAALQEIDADFPGVVLTDVRMPGMSGTELFAALNARDPDLPILLMTGHGDIAMAVAAIRQGAWDFLTKPFDPDALVLAIGRAGKARSLALENRRLRARAAGEVDDALIGDTPEIARLRAMIPVLADAALDIVIEGEMGSGREHLARAIHRAGRRGRHRFLKLDCATLSPGVVADGLLARDGPIARADRGTLFLSRLAAAPVEVQHRLVTFADTRTVALDTRDPEAVDVRIIASVEEGEGGRILPELLHRLAGVPLRMPPLDARREDIPLLLATFAADAAERHRRPMPVLAEQAHALMQRDWPGNVLQLRRFAERLVLGLEPQGVAATAPDASLTARLDAFERQAIVDAVDAAGGEIGAAIAALQLPRKTFYYRVNRLGIDLAALRRRHAGKE